MKIEFNTAKFVFSHGKEPKGRGSWAFAFEGLEPIFSPSMTYAEAKAWARGKVKAVAPAGYAGTVIVDVLS